MKNQRWSNLWAVTAGDPLSAGTLNGSASADLTIIGGGYTGCSAALYAAEAGASVRLLEARTIGIGASGRNVGLVNAGLWTEPDRVDALLGRAAGERLDSALASAPDLVFELVERLDIACMARRCGTLHCAHSGSGLRRLQRRSAQVRARGLEVRLLDAAATASATGAIGFRGSLLNAKAGTIQPLAYARGLARAARRAGSILYEATPAVAIKRSGDGWSVTTPSGRIDTGALILATNAYHQSCEGSPAPNFATVHYFQVATEPLSPERRSAILPGGQGCWDTAPVMTSFRLDSAGRLLLGSVGSLAGRGGSTHSAWVRRRLVRLFPALEDVSIQHVWDGRIAMTADHLPRIETIGPQALNLFGYSGRGIGPGTVFGRAAARALLSGETEGLPLQPVPPQPRRRGAIRQAWVETGATLAHLAGARR